MGIFDTEREAGIMYARARYKYPVQRPVQKQTSTTCPLDLSNVPMDLSPIPSGRPAPASQFKGVTKSKNGEKWVASIKISSEGGRVYLGTFDTEREAGIMHARARHMYPLQTGQKRKLDGR